MTTKSRKKPESLYDQLVVWHMKNGVQLCLEPASLKDAAVDADGMVEVLLREGHCQSDGCDSGDMHFLPREGRNWKMKVPLALIIRRLLEQNTLHLLPKRLWKLTKRPVANVSQPNWSVELEIPGTEYGEQDVLDHFHEIAPTSRDLREYGRRNRPAPSRISSGSYPGRPYRIRVEAVRLDAEYLRLVSQHPETVNGNFSSKFILHYCRQQNPRMVRVTTFRETLAFSLAYDVHHDETTWERGEPWEFKRGFFALGSWVANWTSTHSEKREYPFVVLEGRRRSLDFFANASGAERGREFIREYPHTGLYVLVVVSSPTEETIFAHS